MRIGVFVDGLFLWQLYRASNRCFYAGIRCDNKQENRTILSRQSKIDFLSNFYELLHFLFLLINSKPLIITQI